jgi:collagenase-like PrtC family protease
VPFHSLILWGLPPAAPHFRLLVCASLCAVEKELAKAGIHLKTEAQLKAIAVMAAYRRAWRQVIDEYVELQMVQFRADMSPQSLYYY